MPALLENIDPDGLLEYSVVFTDRSLNHMSQAFQTVMRDISQTLKSVYHAHATIVVPGSGSYGMEAVARQFATDQKCLVIRNGWFSYRWTQIFEMGNIPSQSLVLKAKPMTDEAQSPFSPPPIEEVVATILAEKPAMVFAPHVETSSGMMLPNDYISTMADAVHSVGGMLVIDCIASGTIWLDMNACGIDILISAPQKGWSSSPCCGLVMLSELARQRIEETTSSSFTCDLAKWLQIMEAYEQGGHAYHATMPTDSLRQFRDMMLNAKDYGFVKIKAKQIVLGKKVRKLLDSYDIKSVAAPGFEAPGVIVSYTNDNTIQNGKKFAKQGLQIAAGVPLQCDESEDFQTFRLGLFGFDKLNNIDRTLANLEQALTRVYNKK